MEKFFFIRPLLKLLAQEKVFRKLVSVTLRILAAVIVLGSLAPFFKAGKVVFELPASGILGGIMFQLFFIVAIYAVVHVLLIRAGDIDELKTGNFSVLPLTAVLLKALGEMYASFVSLVSVGGGIFVWFTGRKVEAILSPMPAFFPPMGDPNFMGGIEFMFRGALISIAVLIATYVVAEILNVAMKSMSVKISKQTETNEGTNGMPRQPREQNVKTPYRI